MNNDKAPLPDKVKRDTAFADLSERSHNDMLRHKALFTLGRYIAALEHRHDDLVTRCVQAEADRDKLEASNNRLREVIAKASDAAFACECYNVSRYLSAAIAQEVKS